MTDREIKSGHSATHFWFRHHFAHRYFICVPYSNDERAHDCVMDDYGNLVRVS